MDARINTPRLVTPFYESDDGTKWCQGPSILTGYEKDKLKYNFKAPYTNEYLSFTINFSDENFIIQRLNTILTYFADLNAFFNLLQSELDNAPDLNAKIDMLQTAINDIDSIRVISYLRSAHLFFSQACDFFRILEGELVFQENWYKKTQTNIYNTTVKFFGKCDKSVDEIGCEEKNYYDNLQANIASSGLDKILPLLNLKSSSKYFVQASQLLTKVNDLSDMLIAFEKARLRQAQNSPHALFKKLRAEDNLEVNSTRLPTARR